MYINNTEQKPKRLKLTKPYPKKNNTLIVLFGACEIIIKIINNNYQ